jgi:hypothetical protein
LCILASSLPVQRFRLEVSAMALLITKIHDEVPGNGRGNGAPDLRHLEEDRYQIIRYPFLPFSRAGL